ncbi:conjugative transposon protein TraM [Muricauda sp. 334s03]|uniref:Conjugative transposon protein TraM n=1 Tax=Flagellimonas yonaguniensis TaxID=3031325 RepID=A0ABT5Y4A9_9FLAO|nr:MULTISPECIES: conjugative transposon protein TraM [Allomuricauda]MDF0718183.1 conjugative transposon protein TraM [[Muricauda] yonaguniensis]NDV17519.1 conjugative transposon protein TraM [Muricauda sp. TY007]
MKVEKNKIVFAAVMLCVVLFIVGYAMMALGGDEEPSIDNNQIPVPELGEEQEQYKTKLEALDAIKEERQTNAPSIYDEGLLDSTGVYDPDLMEKKRIRIIDSIYNEGRIDYSEGTYRKSKTAKEALGNARPDSIATTKEMDTKDPSVEVKELALEHELFFASNPMERLMEVNETTDAQILARVDGTQTVRQHNRLRMRLLEEAMINGTVIPRNTAIYGFVSFKPNRAMINIEHIDHNPINLGAYDLQDGSEGIYIENSFRAEAGREVVGDAIDDINIGGVPQVRGIKSLFQRDNRQVKVTVMDNYQLILKLK